MTPTYVSPCGRLVLYNGDARVLLPTVPTASVDVVVDPPYGIGADASHQKSRADKQHGKACAPSKNYGATDWDSVPCPEEVLDQYERVGVSRIIFGGNYFRLPPSRCWLVWDKLNGENHYADCELAWTNIDKPVRLIRFRWHGMLRDEPGDRVHPTQKPVGVMVWAVRHLPPSMRPILDAMMGSGTTGVAALRLGRPFVGCEVNPRYFEIAKERCLEALDAEPLFEEVDAAPVEQLDLFEDAAT